VPRRRRRKRTW